MEGGSHIIDGMRYPPDGNNGTAIHLGQRMCNDRPYNERKRILSDSDRRRVYS